MPDEVEKNKMYRYYKNIKIEKFKGIVKCQLLKLGKINTICGKNNSGKSTILKALISKNLASGINFTEDEIKRFYETFKFQYWYQQNYVDKDIHTKSYKQVFSNVFAVNTFFYSNEWDKLFNLLISEFEKFDDLKNSKFVFGNVKDIFYDIYNYQPEIILLEPKRNPFVICNIASFSQDATLSTTNNNLLNLLFWYKNNNPGREQNKLYNKLKKAFFEISVGSDFDVNLHLHASNNSQIELTFGHEDNWYPAENCGIGLRDLLVILSHSIFLEGKLILIEEPENHIHPDMQRKLLSFLKKETENQYILTTHSNIFVDSTYVDKIYSTSYENTEIKIKDDTSKAGLLHDLGYSVTENILSDIILLVEGPNDKPIIEEFLEKIGIWSKYDLKIWFLGGDIMDQIDLTVLSQGYKAIALVDNDPKSKTKREKFERLCKENSIPCTRLQRYAIENYFTLNAIRHVFGKQLDDNVKEIKFNEKLQDQIGIDVKKNNRKIVREMSISDIKGTDLYEFLLKVQSICESNVT